MSSARSRRSPSRLATHRARRGSPLHLQRGRDLRSLEPALKLGVAQREVAVVAAPQRPRQRLLEPLGGEGLQEVVDRLEFEGVEAELAVGGDEDEGRPLVGRQARHELQAAQVRHLDIQEHDVGLEPLDQAEPAPAVRRRPDQSHAGASGQPDLHAPDAERLIIDDD